MTEIESRASATPPVPAALSTEPVAKVDAEFDAVQALTRLLLGAALDGSDELLSRLRQWDAAPRAVEQSGAKEPPSAALRYALVGLLFDAEARIRARLARAGRLSHRLTDLFYAAMEPVAYFLPIQPALDTFDELVERAQFELYRWMQLGRREEQRGRALARQATGSSIDELLEYLAHNPAIRELIEQQGVSVAGTAVDEVRERMVSADAWVERLARGMLRRPARETEAPPAPEKQDAGAR